MVHKSLTAKISFCVDITILYNVSVMVILHMDVFDMGSFSPMGSMVAFRDAGA